MKKYNLLFLFVFCYLNLSAQFENVEQVQIDRGNNSYTVMNLYNEGVAIEKRSTEEFIFYNKNLKKKGSAKYYTGSQDIGQLFLGSPIIITAKYYDTIIKSIVILYGKDAKVTHCALISPLTRETKYIKIKYPKSSPRILRYTRLHKVDNMVFVNTVKGKKSGLSTINLEDGKVTPLLLPEEWKKRYVVDLKRVNSKYLAVLYRETDDKDAFQNIALINDKGNIVKDKLIKSDKNNQIISFEFSNIDENQILMSGAYQSGLYIAKFTELDQSFISFFDYKSIKKFYTFLPKSDKDNKDYYAAVHPVIGLNGEYILTAECSFKTRIHFRDDLNSPLVSVYNVTHEVLLTIDDDGDLKNEFCFPVKAPLNDYYVVNETKFLNSCVVNNSVNYSYPDSNILFSFTYSNGKLTKNEPINFEDLVDSKKGIKENSSTFDYWYDNFYVSYSAVNSGESEGKGIFKSDIYLQILVKYQIDSSP